MIDLIHWVTQNVLSVSLGIIGIGVLIAVHEFGHFVMCKLFGIHTPSFAIGFGPTLLSRQCGATTFTLKSIPLGGYVEIAGLAEPGQGNQDEADRHDQYAFTTKPYYQKLSVALGGIIFNIIFSIVAFTGILYVGAPATPLLYPYNTSHVVAHIRDDVQDETRITTDDRIVRVNNAPVTRGRDIISTARSADDTDQISVTFERDSSSYTTSIDPSWLTSGGITLKLMPVQASSLMEALADGTRILIGVTKQVYMALYNVIAQRQTQHLGGPLMIIAASAHGAHNGIATFILFLGFLSVNLAALNILPIPVLDGGHIVFLTIEHVTGRSIPPKVRGLIDYIFALLLIGAIIIISFFDVWKLFSG